MCFNLDLGHSLGLKRYNYIVLQMIITNMYLKDLTIIGLPLIIVIGNYVYEIMQKNYIDKLSGLFRSMFDLK